MLERLHRLETEERSNRRDERADERVASQRSGQRRQPEGSEGTAASRPATESLAFRLGRVLLGGVLAFMAFDNLRQLDGRIAYAASKGAPKPEVTVPAVSGLLQAGSVGVALWRLPTLSTAAVATFFASVTPVMHDFWAIDDEQERQQQMIHFLKNTALFAAALLLFGLGRRSD